MLKTPIGDLKGIDMHASAGSIINKITISRVKSSPLITSSSSSSLGDNINGPSVIRVPQWINDPLGKYYMYFAHHSGTYIRLAYADNLEGPWLVYEPGALQLADAAAFTDHLASPDVHVDNDAKHIRMYFHGVINDEMVQGTGVALSDDGIDFTVSNEILGKFYFRVWRWGEYWFRR